MEKFIFIVVFLFSCVKTSLQSVNNVNNVQEYISQDSLVLDGYFDSFTNTNGDTAVLYLSSKKNTKFVKLNIYDINGNVVDYINCDSIIPQKATGDSIAKYGYSYSYKIKFKINSPLKSGIFLISNKIPFLIKSKFKNSDVLVIYPSNTVEAYNSSNGKNLYTFDSNTKKYYGVVSFHRPKYVDYYSISFLKKYSDSNFDYISDFELEKYTNINNYKLIIFIGHNEYWTRNAKNNFDQFIFNGGNSLILSGNTCWWNVRYSNDFSQLFCYKDYNKDPEVNPLLKTINWTDQRLESTILSSIGADFDHGGYGLNVDNGWDGYKILLPNSPILYGTNLKYFDTLKLPSVEYDGTITIFDKINNVPKLDTSKLKFFKVELIGYDFGYRNSKTIPTFIVFQKTKSSGIIINVCSTNWCSNTGLEGTNGNIIKKITDNCINLLKSNNLPPFVY